MKKWIILALATATISSCLHFYLANRTYELVSGQAKASSICSINEKINCDPALLSPYSRVFGVSLSNFGFSFNLSLTFLLLSFLFGFFQNSFARITFVYLSGTIASASVIMFFVSIVKSLYCPICWTTYSLSFISLGSLFWAFRKDVLKVSFLKVVLKALQNKTVMILALCIFMIAFFLHMVFVTNLNINGSVQQSKALILDWEGEEVFNFSMPPILKKGPEDAKIVIVEFADFLCPSCKNAEPSLKTFLRIRPDVAFHFYTFPLDQTCNSKVQHRGSGLSCVLSRVTLCAEQQGKGWQAHDFIFEKQGSFRESISNKKKVDQLLKSLVQEAKIDSQKFSNCMESPKIKKIVEDMAELGVKANVIGTPSFFINGKFLHVFSNQLTSVLSYIYDHLER